MLFTFFYNKTDLKLKQSSWLFVYTLVIIYSITHKTELLLWYVEIPPQFNKKCLLKVFAGKILTFNIALWFEFGVEWYKD